MINFIDNMRYTARRRRFEQFMREFRPAAADKILEVGVASREYSPVDNFLIKNYPYPNRITALGIGDLEGFKKNFPDVTAVSYDGGRFPFKDKEFDVAHSNAVIEHVGDRDAQLLFLKEIARASKRGMLMTPNRYFPIELHTRVLMLHWLRKEWFDRFLVMIGKGWAAGDGMNLLSKRDILTLAEKAGLRNYRIIRNRFLGFTVVFTLVWYNE